MKLKNFDDYEIDIENGTLFSYKSNTTIGHLDNDGYVCTTIYNNDGKRFTVRLHRLVWETVNGEIPYGYEVHHLDENRSNNSISNLELIEASEHKHRHFVGVNNPMYNKPNPKAALIGRNQSKSVCCYTKEGELIKTYEAIADVKTDGFLPCNVSHCCNGDYATYKGYIWKFMG